MGRKYVLAGGVAWALVMALVAAVAALSLVEAAARASDSRVGTQVERGAGR